jgi:hypothetical protein
VIGASIVVGTGMRSILAPSAVLDVRGRVLRARQARGGELELAPVDHDRRAREPVVLSRVVDVRVRVRVEDPAHVFHRHAVERELVLEPLLLARVADHPEPRHDLGARRAGVDEDGIVTAEDQVRPGLRPRDDAHVVGEDEEARLDVDVHQVEHLDLVLHRHSSAPERNRGARAITNAGSVAALVSCS